MQFLWAETTCQVTPPLLGSPVTIALNCWVPPDCTEGLFGETEIAIPGTVMVAVPTTAESVTEVAVSVTDRLPAGGAVGAVYVAVPPLAVFAGETPPQADCEQDTVHFTPAFPPSLLTVAEKGACAPSCTVAEVGDRFTATAGTVMTAVCNLLASLTEVAVRLTVREPVCELGGV